MVGYRADDLRDRRYHHRHPFIPEETAQCSAQKIALLITIQSHEICQNTSNACIRKNIHADL